MCSMNLVYGLQIASSQAPLCMPCLVCVPQLSSLCCPLPPLSPSLPPLSSPLSHIHTYCVLFSFSQSAMYHARLLTPAPSLPPPPAPSLHRLQNQPIRLSPAAAGHLRTYRSIRVGPGRAMCRERGPTAKRSPICTCPLIRLQVRRWCVGGSTIALALAN